MADRSFIVGETIHFQILVSDVGTKKPTNPDVVELYWLGLAGGSNLLGAPLAFDQDKIGQFSLTWDSTGQTPGTYSLRARATAADPLRAKIITDTFVLSA